MKTCTTTVLIYLVLVILGIRAQDNETTTTPAATAPSTTVTSTSLEALVISETETAAEPVTLETTPSSTEVSQEITLSNTDVPTTLASSQPTTTPGADACVGVLIRPVLSCQGCKTNDDCADDMQCCGMAFFRSYKCCGRRIRRPPLATFLSNLG